MAIVLFLALSLNAQAETFFNPGSYLKAEIQSKKDRSLLYTYERFVKQEGDVTRVTRQYNYPDGKPAATETAYYKDGKVFRMELDETQLGSKGFFDIKDGKVNFSYTKEGKTKTDSEKLDSNFVSQDEITGHIYNHWDEIIKGKTIHVRLPVIFRRETVGFKFFKDKETDKEIIIKMKPSSFIIAALVDPLYFHMQKDGDHRVIFVDGRVTPKINEGGKWKDLDAYFVLKFDASPSKKE